MTPSGLRSHCSRESSVLKLASAVSLDDLSPAWAWGGATGKGVRVAVIDSGIDADHPMVGDAIDQDNGVVITLGFRQ